MVLKKISNEIFELSENEMKKKLNDICVELMKNKIVVEAKKKKKDSDDDKNKIIKNYREKMCEIRGEII